MSAIEALGLTSLAVCVAFTWASYAHGEGRRAAIIEAWVNIAFGFSLNFTLNLVLIPLATHGGHLSGSNNFWMGWVYTLISMFRQYTIRRWFATRFHQAALFFDRLLAGRI